MLHIDTLKESQEAVTMAHDYGLGLTEAGVKSNLKTLTLNILEGECKRLQEIKNHEYSDIELDKHLAHLQEQIKSIKDHNA